MRTLTRSKAIAAVAGGLLIAGGGIAAADNLVNNVTVGGTDTITAGGSTTVGYKINATGGDGQSGCNASDGSAATVTLSVPPDVTSSAARLIFTACNATQNVTFSSSKAGSYAINASVSDPGVGTYSNQADFSLTVNAPPLPPNTAPSVSVTGVTANATYNKGSVPAAGCSVTDTEDGSSSFPASLSAVTGTYASDGIGSQTASCSYTDSGGLAATPTSASYSIVDPSAPVIGKTLDPAAPDGDNGWYTGNVELTWTVTENESPNSLQETGCVDQNITADQVATTYDCSATSAGGSAGPESVTIKRDGTKPTSMVSGAVEGAVYAVAPTITCQASDNLSGVATVGSPSGNTTTAGAKTVTCNGATDMAGNTQTAASVAVSYRLAPMGGYNANFDASSVLRVKPNQAIPLNWSFSDGLTKYALLHTAQLSSVSSTRCTSTSGTDGTEIASEVASGTSGLQLLTDNSYQMNWKANSTTGCRALTVTMDLKSGGSTSRTVLVDVRK